MLIARIATGELGRPDGAVGFIAEWTDQRTKSTKRRRVYRACSKFRGYCVTR
jgi:hypothetical protein